MLIIKHLGNHRSLADYGVLGYIAETNNLRGNYNFLAWKRCFRISDLKAYVKSLQISPNWNLTESETFDIFNEALSSRSPFWLFLFPEVNILTNERIEQVYYTLLLFYFIFYFLLSNCFYLAQEVLPKQ